MPPGYSRRLTALAAMVLTAALTWGTSSTAAAEDPPQGELRRTLFGAADEALASANQYQASLLAPRSYSAGAEDYRRAEAILESGGDLATIQRHLDRARSEFSRARATSSQPSSRANSTPAALVIVICVEAWIGKSGETYSRR